MKTLILVAGLVLQCLASSHAATSYMLCDYCSESEIRALASQSAPSRPGINRYDIYVANLNPTVLRRFRLTVVVEPETDYRHLRQLSPSASESLRFEQFAGARDQILRALGEMDFSIEIPPGHFVSSAYDLWGNHRNQLLLQEHINNELGFLETAFSNMFAYSAFLLNRRNSEFFVKVVFPDGTLALFELQGKTEDLIWTYRSSESTDQDGNLIPDTLEDFSAYSGLFNSVSIQGFLIRAGLYGIPLIDRRRAGSRIAVVCVHGAKGDYLCEATSVQ